MRGKGFGYTHCQWKRWCAAVLVDLQWGHCQANQFWATSSSAESRLVPMFLWGSEGWCQGPGSSSRFFPTGVSEEGWLGSSGVNYSLVDLSRSPKQSVLGGIDAFAYGYLVAGLYKALQQSNASCCFSKELLKENSHIAYKDPRMPCAFL